jgi:calcineurin-like phosphoesterase family protein
MRTYLISDTHLKHAKVATYCQRPEGFTELIDENVRKTVKPEDLLIHLGDVGIDKAEGPDGFMKIVRTWPGRKVLVRGNHDKKSSQWYMEHGFDFAVDAMIYRGMWLTHKPSDFLPPGCQFNLHGHLHNVWDGFGKDDPEAANDEFSSAFHSGKLAQPWQRLFAVEYTNYMPVDFDKFVSKPDKFQSRGPAPKKFSEVRDQLVFTAPMPSDVTKYKFATPEDVRKIFYSEPMDSPFDFDEDVKGLTDGKL